MFNVGKLNIISEDIFQSCSEPSENKLRRSQRILEKKLVSGENISEVCLSQNLNAPIFPNQLELKNIEEVKGIDGEITPDFTYMLNTQDFFMDKLEATQKQMSTLDNENPKEFCDKSSVIDLYSISKKNIEPSEDLKMKKTNCRAVEKRKMCTSGPWENAKKVSQINTEKENVGSFNAFVEVKTESHNIPLQDDRSGNDEVNKLFEQTTEKIIQPLHTEEKTQIAEDNVCAKKQELSKLELPTETIYDRKSTQEKEIFNLSQKNLAVKTDAKIGRKRGRKLKENSSKIKKTQQKAKESIQTTKLKGYVAPKVVRYYNSCPTIQIPYAGGFNPNGVCALNRSLLPAVYPPHFTHQIIIPSDIKQSTNIDLPISCLTPENSQVMYHQDAIAETKNSAPSTPSSVNSLREFFEIDELCEIENIEKTIYHLTEFHVRALAFTLNVHLDSLITAMDKIVELDDNILRDISKMYAKDEQQEAVRCSIQSNNSNE